MNTKTWRLSLFLMFLFVCFDAGTVEADIILAPTTITSDMGQAAQAVSLDNLRNQNLLVKNGVFSGYTSGVTNFNTYIAGAPTHASTNTNDWFSANGNTTGTVDFDFGTSVTLDAMVLWNEEASSAFRVTQFDLSADDDGDFTNGGTISLLTSQATNTTGGFFVLPEVFSFSPTSLQTVRMTITGNGGAPTNTGMGEVAFRTGTAVPEPSSLALLGLGGIGLLVRRRRTSWADA